MASNCIGDLMDFKELAIKNKLSYNFVVKEHMLLKSLAEVYKLPFKIVLKGGTAINQIYLKDFQRFSEDLDFDIFDNVTLEQLKKELEKLGFDIKKGFYRPGRIGFETKYEIEEIKDIIKLEFNIENNKFLETRGVLRNAESNIANFTVANIKAYPIETLILQKINALIGRDDGKDYYDLFYTSKITNITIIKKEVKEWVNNKLIYKDFKIKAIEKISKIDNKILVQTNSFIPKDKRIDWNIIKEDVKEFIEKL